MAHKPQNMCDAWEKQVNGKKKGRQSEVHEILIRIDDHPED